MHLYMGARQHWFIFNIRSNNSQLNEFSEGFEKIQIGARTF